MEDKRIAVTSSGTDLNSEMDPRFGRAAYFIIADPETMQYEVVENRQNLDLPQGAGIQAGKTIVESGAAVLITGFCGPKAYKVLESAGIQTITGAKGKVGDVLSEYKSGKFTKADDPNVEGHWV
mgnify:CR=1 FL=1